MAIIKHTAKPATAEEIRRAVGVTEEDRKIVDRVLAELGYPSGRGPIHRGSSAGTFSVTKAAKTATAKTGVSRPAAKKSTAPKSTSRKAK